MVTDNPYSSRKRAAVAPADVVVTHPNTTRVTPVTPARIGLSNVRLRTRFEDSDELDDDNSFNTTNGAAQQGDRVDTTFQALVGYDNRDGNHNDEIQLHQEEEENTVATIGNNSTELWPWDIDLHNDVEAPFRDRLLVKLGFDNCTSRNIGIGIQTRYFQERLIRDIKIDPTKGIEDGAKSINLIRAFTKSMDAKFPNRYRFEILTRNKKIH